MSVPFLRHTRFLYILFSHLSSYYTYGTYYPSNLFPCFQYWPAFQKPYRDFTLTTYSTLHHLKRKTVLRYSDLLKHHLITKSFVLNNYVNNFHKTFSTKHPNLIVLTNSFFMNVVTFACLFNMAKIVPESV